MVAEVKFEIDVLGNLTISVNGVEGTACTKLTEGLEAKIADVMGQGQKTLTDDYYRDAKVQEAHLTVEG